MVNFFLFAFLSGLFFQIINHFKIRFFEILSPIAFPLLSFYLLKNIGNFEIINENIFLVQKNIIIGLGVSFFIFGLFFLFEKDRKNIYFFVFLYYDLANILVFLDNIFYIFIILELLTILGTIFIVVDTSIKEYKYLKEISVRYFITHCFAGLIFLFGLSLILNSNYPNFSLSSLTNENISIGHIFIVFSLLINTAIPIFSSWLVQGYSSCRFSLSFILYAVVTKVSIFLLTLIVPLTNLDRVMMWISLITMCYGCLMTIIESNIRKFIAYTTISHNGLFLLMISEVAKIGTANFYYNFGNFIFFSMIIQDLVLGIAYTISYKSDSWFFLDIEKNIVKYKSLFFLVLISNLIYIGIPLTPIFQFKNLILKNLDDVYQPIFYFTIIISIFSHLFIYPFRIFKNKDINFSTNSFSPIMYKRNLFIILIILGYLLFMSRIYIPDFQDIHKYAQFIIASGIIFIFSHKIIGKNRRIILDFDLLFYQFKLILYYIFFSWRNILSKIYSGLSVLANVVLISRKGRTYFNTYNCASFALLLFTIYILCFIF